MSKNLNRVCAKEFSFGNLPAALDFHDNGSGGKIVVVRG